MLVGFTGSRETPSSAQEQWLTEVLWSLEMIEFHHGDCLGADALAHTLVREIAPGIRIVIHPPLDPRLRAYREGDEILSVKPYLERNKDIVDSTEILIGLPSGPEYLRSGTWSTIRYAQSLGHQVLLPPEFMSWGALG